MSDLNLLASTAIDGILSRWRLDLRCNALIGRTFSSRIEETWRLWQKFLEDFSRFEEWLKASERTAALPNSSGVLYTVAKEELKKFEACLLFSLCNMSTFQGGLVLFCLSPNANIEL